MGKELFSETLSNEITGWPTKWAHHRKKIQRIQKRIFKASKLGNYKCCQRLQRRLINSRSAKLFAVHHVAQINKGKRSAGVDKMRNLTASEKLDLAKLLRVDLETDKIRRIWLPKPGRTEKRPLGIPTIRDRAKQKLVLLALEPQYEAHFAYNSYGYRPGRRAQDAVEAIFSSSHHGTPLSVYCADISKCYDRIDHNALIEKLDPIIPFYREQIRAWLKAGILDELNDIETEPQEGTPQGSIISPLLANIALDGIEDAIYEAIKHSRPRYKSSWNKDGRPGRTLAREYASACVVRYADDIILAHKDPSVLDLMIHTANTYLETIGVSFNKDKSIRTSTLEGFDYLGFHFQHVGQYYKNQWKMKITPSKEGLRKHKASMREILKRNRRSTVGKLINDLEPVMRGYINYIQYVEASQSLYQLDNFYYQSLRAFVMRRHPRKSRTFAVRKYFTLGLHPEDKPYKRIPHYFQGRTYHHDWVLMEYVHYTKTYLYTRKGVTTRYKKRQDKRFKTQVDKMALKLLPRYSWYSVDVLYAKVKQDNSVYDGNNLYWAMRSSKQWSTLSTRQTTLIKRQNGRCAFCEKAIMETDLVEVDHIIPLFAGGKDIYKNMQLLHKDCHRHKTENDLKKIKDKFS